VKYHSGQDITHAATILGGNGLVAIPTETVYGLAANAFNEEAVLKIFEAKKRPAFDPLIVHCASFEMVSQISQDFPDTLRKLCAKFWPGPLTVVVEKSHLIPDLVTSGFSTVGIRIPNHPMTLKLLDLLDFPLAAPSANPFTYVSPTSPEHVANQLGNQVDYILDGGESGIGIESTIVRFRNNTIEILRLGGLSIEEIEVHVQVPVTIVDSKDNISIPGNFKKHYSNSKDIKLYSQLPEPVYSKDEAWLYFSKSHCKVPTENCWFLSENGSTKEAASNLFKMLRAMDVPEIRTVHAELAPTHGLGPAINDRLKRASAR